MVRELARLSPPSGPHPPRCLRWCSRAVWETAPSSTRRPPASPCSVPRITPSCSVLCLCPRWVWCDILCWFDSINLISLLLSQPNDFQHSTHFPCHCHSKYFNNVPRNENFTIKFSVIRTLYTRRRSLVTRITRPALAQTQTRPPHPRWDIAWHIILLFTFNSILTQVDVRWNMIACGKTRPSLDMTEHARQYLSGIKPRSLNLWVRALRSLTAPNFTLNFKFLSKQSLQHESVNYWHGQSVNVFVIFWCFFPSFFQV